MKRILILTILLMSSLAWAGSTTVVVGQGGSGGGGGGFVGINDAATTTVAMESGLETNVDGFWIRVAASATGTVSYMHIRESSGFSTSENNGGAFKMFIFDDSNAYLGQTACTFSGGDGVLDGTLSSPVSVTSGTYYRIGITGRDTYYVAGAIATGGPTNNDDQMIATTSSPCPDSLSSTTLQDDGDTHATRGICIWADNTASY